MSKYIIELNEECAIGFIAFGTDGDGKVICTTRYIDTLEQYTPVDIEDVYDKAYTDGYNNGLKDGKAVNDKGCEGCKYAEMGSDTTICAQCCNGYPNQWTAKDDKIEVGDEVEPFYTNITGVVTLIDGDTIYILWRDGSSTSAMKLKEVTKTGRHFDIQSILEDMKHD